MKELISKSDFQNLPEDLEDCFLSVEEVCRGNTEYLMHNADNNNDLARIAMLNYMAVISASAQECGVADLNYDGSDNVWAEYENFSRTVQGLVARIRIRKRRGVTSTESVLLTLSAKAKIKIQIEKLRSVIAESDLDSEKKLILDKKLDALFDDVEKSPRLSFGKTLATLALVAAALAGVTTIAADGPEAIQNILRFIGKEQESEDEAVRRLAPPPVQPKLLTASIEAKAKSQSSSFGRPKPSSSHLDDDIPF